MKPHVRRRVARFLRWMVQHEHHAGGWRGPHTDPPRSWHTFWLRGYSAQITVARSTMEAAAPYFGNAMGKQKTRMFYPNADGFELIRQECPL